MNLLKNTVAGFAIAFATGGIAHAEAPTELGIGLILSAGPEAAWDGTLLRDVEALESAAPHGLHITSKHIDGVWGEQAGDAMDLLAKTGKYQIIWANSSYSDQVKVLKDKYPEILFVVVGSGNEGLGGNSYWVYKRAHEPSFLMGVMAGRLTKTNTIGAVGQFPSEDVNDQINAYFAGAKSVNPNVKQKVAFIESWYDPAKAEQFTNAQIAANADQIFQLVESFETCKKAKIACYGNYVDQGAASDSVVASATISWKPDLNWIVDQWFDHAANGAPYAGNTKEHWFSMTEGGADLSGYHAYDAVLSSDLKAEISKLKDDIMTGKQVIPVDLSVPSSN